jgi:hypothetical protein
MPKERCATKWTLSTRNKLQVSCCKNKMSALALTSATANAIIEWNEKLCKPDAPLIKLAMAWPAAALDVSDLKYDTRHGAHYGQCNLVTITQINDGQTAKAMFPTTGTHQQEAVFTIVGALRAKDLPPVKGTKCVDHHTACRDTTSHACSTQNEKRPPQVR